MTAKKQHLNEQKLVREYLIQNPDFFGQNPDVFEAINISHESGKAISLVERQVSLMRQHNTEMMSQIDQMSRAAKENAVLMEKTNRLVLSLVKAQDLTHLINALTVSLKTDFATEFFSLTLLENDKYPIKTATNLVPQNEAKLKIGHILQAKNAVCGVMNDEAVLLLFGKNAKSVGSVLALPLKHTHAYGVIALGHSDPDFYTDVMGTVFIDYIGDLLNQLIPNYINLKD
jgi:uncharacterized protein YigA (DUF484 family)